jgi:hypothetical protein
MPAKFLPAWASAAPKPPAEATPPPQLRAGGITAGLAKLAADKEPEETAPQDVIDARLAICDDCDDSRPIELPVTSRRCLRCGCFAKTLASSTKLGCPAGLWR